MKINDREAYNKVISARTTLLITNGFFGFLAMQLNLIEVQKGGGIETMAVDGKNMFYWPEFVHSLTPRELEFVVAHEVMHCCFSHFSRRQARDPQKWNIAGDYVINMDLTEAGFTAPKKALLDPKYKGLNTEEVYERLPDIKIIIKAMGGDGNSKDIGGCGAVLDAPGGDSERQETAREWETSVRTALEVARANNAGNLPGSLKDLIDQLNQPKVSWRDLTKQWIDQSLVKDTSWSRLSRRSYSVGVPLPGLISDRLQHLVCAVDTSGSCMNYAKDFVSEVAGALDQGTADKLTVIYADTDVQHVDEYLSGDVVDSGIYSGGGTAFSNTFKWIKDNAPDASAVIYFTDLEVHDFGEEPDCPMLWAVYSPFSSYVHLAEQAPFGTCIHVSDQG